MGMKKRNRILQWVMILLILAGIFLVSFNFRYLVKDYKEEIRTVDYDIHTMSHVSELEEEIQLYPWTEIDNTTSLTELAPSNSARQISIGTFEQFGMSLIWGFQEMGLIGSFRCESDVASYIRIDGSTGKSFYDKIPLYATNNEVGDYYFSMVSSEYQGLEYLELVYEPYDDVVLDDSALREIERKLQDDLNEFRESQGAVDGYEGWSEYYDEKINGEANTGSQKSLKANIYQQFLDFWGFMEGLGWNNTGFYRDFLISCVYWNDVEILQNQGKYLIIFSSSEEYGMEGQELILIYDPILGGITGCSMRY